MKIYFVPLARVARADGMDEIVDHAASLGFDAIASNAVPETAILNTPRCYRDDQDERCQQKIQDTLVNLGAVCQKQDLELMLDLALDRSDTPPGFLKLHPEWFSPGVATEAPPPDPRFVGQRPRLPQIRWNSPEIEEAILAFWTARLKAFADMGASRFRCLSPAMAPAGIWRKLIARVRGDHPACAFHAWTPGLSWEDITALAGLGFAGGFTSSAWWDCQSPWLISEREILEQIGPSIAFPEAPPGERLPPALFRNYARGPDGGRTAMVRALFVAAAIGDGILLPMGFEYGGSSTAQTSGSREELERLRRQAPFDLCAEVRAANAMIDHATASRLKGLRLIDGSGGTSRLCCGPMRSIPILPHKAPPFFSILILPHKLPRRCRIPPCLPQPELHGSCVIRRTTSRVRSNPARSASCGLSVARRLWQSLRERRYKVR